MPKVEGSLIDAALAPTPDADAEGKESEQDEKWSLDDADQPDGFDEEPEAEPAKPEAKPEPEAEEEKKPEVEQVDDVTKRLETLEQRFKDTQAWGHREHQAALAAQADAEALRKQVETLSPNADVPELPDEGSYLTADERKVLARTAGGLTKLEKLFTDMEAANQQQRWDAQAKPVRDANDDFDSVIADFETAWRNDAALQARFRDEGGTPEAAYKLGNELQRRRKMLEDPEAFEKELLEKAKQQAREELDAAKADDGQPTPAKPKADDVPDSLAGVQSKPVGKAGRKTPSGSPLDQFLAG